MIKKVLKHSPSVVTLRQKTFLPSHKALRASPIFASLALDQTPVYTVRPRICG